jgi:hypothetical protein
MRQLLFVAMLAPLVLGAQARVRPDPRPPRTPEWLLAGAQVKQRPAASPRTPIAAQFDSLGLSPLGERGDTVTLYLFPDQANLTARRHAVITARQRFFPPTSWRAACDEVAHPGWFFSLAAPPTSAFAIVVAGKREMPVVRPAPPLAKAGAEFAFRMWADSAWLAYEQRMQPRTDRERASLYYSFHGEAADAGWSKVKLFGFRGPRGHDYAAFSVWLRDDSRDGTPNTTATWIIDAWGRLIARAPGNVDIYGASDGDGDGIDELITSSGLIRWAGEAFAFPTVYPDEPCLAKRVMTPPKGVRP